MLTCRRALIQLLDAGMYAAKFVSSAAELSAPFSTSGYLYKQMMTWVLLLVTGVTCVVMLLARWSYKKLMAAERLLADFRLQTMRENEMKALQKKNAVLVYYAIPVTR